MASTILRLAKLSGGRTTAYFTALSVLLALPPVTAVAQSIGVNAGPVAATSVSPGTSVVVPIIIDLSTAGSLNIKSLQSGITWNSAVMTFDSIKVAPASGWTTFTSNTAGAGAGSISFNASRPSALPGSGTLANAFFTGGPTYAGTSVVLTPTAATNSLNASILPALRPRAEDVCVVTPGSWGDATGDGTINIIDAQQIAAFSVGSLVSNTVAVALRGDVTGDGNINIVDAQQVAAFSVGSAAVLRIGTPAPLAVPSTAVAVSPNSTQNLTIGQSSQLNATPSAGAVQTGCATTAWTTTNGAVATVNASGFVTAMGAGSATITATSGSGTAQVAFVVIPVPVAAVTVSLTQSTVTPGGGTTATAVALDAGNNVLVGRPVTFSSSNPLVASVNPATGAVTGLTPGNANIIATSVENPAISGQATLTVSLVMVVSTISSQNIGAPFNVTISLTDGAGNPVLNTGALGTLTLTRQAGTGTLGGTLSGTIAVGQSSITISGVTYSVAESGVVLKVTGSGPGSTVNGATVNSNAFTVAAPAATKLLVTTNATQSAGTAFSVTVTLADAANNPINNTGATGTVTLTLQTGTGTLAGTLTGTIPVGSSVVTISGVTYSKIEAGVVLKATGTGASSAVNGKIGSSNAFTVASGPASRLTITIIPQQVAGAPFSVTVALTDASGNPTNASGGTGIVTLTRQSGTGLLEGTLTGTIPSGASTVTISGVTYSKSETGVILTALGSGTGTVVGKTDDSNPFTVVAGAAVGMTVANVGSPVAGVPFNVVATLVDVKGNAVNNSGASGSVALSRQAGTGLLGGTLTGTIPVGSSAVTMSAVTYSLAESGVILLATGSGSGSGVVGKSGATGAFVVSGSGGIGTLSGTVSPVGGGVIDVLSGTNLVTTITVAANGSYSASLPAGPYSLMLQPPLSQSIGPSEPYTKPATVSNGTTTTVNFVVQPAVAFDDFQAYSTTQLKGHCGLPLVSGDFWFGNQHLLSCAISGGTQIVVDPAGGNSIGPKAARYDWLTNGGGGGIAGYLSPTFKNITGTGINQNMWIRWTSKESQGFQHGGAGAIGSAAQYKFFLIQIAEFSAGAPQFGIYLNGGSNGIGDPSKIHIDMIDRLGNFNFGSNFFMEDTWSGQYHTWVAQMIGMGTSACTFTLFMDGVEIDHTTAPFLPGQSVSDGILTLAMGANINNGPDQPQSRWFRELGVYSTRPSLKKMVP